VIEQGPRLFLIGLMGSGKSTVGRKLASRTGWPYVDNDELVRDVTGRTAPEIVAEGGPDRLHEAELAAFARGAALPAPVIVGVPGYAVMDEGAQRTLGEAGTTIWLRARPETLHRRVGTGRGRRPAATSLNWVRDVVAERTPTFERVADHIIDVDRIRPPAVANEILRRIGVTPRKR
jgi:shikimate kinase